MITLNANITLPDQDPISVNKKNGLSIDAEIIDRGDVVLPSWGIISNGGRIHFMDFNGSIKKYARQGDLTQGLPVEISLCDTSGYNAVTTLGNFVTRTWDYDSNSREVYVEITDELEQWQDIVVDVLPFRQSTKSVTGEDIYRLWYAETPIKFKMKAFEYLDTKTQAELRLFKVPTFISNATNLWSAWSKLCEAVHARIFRNTKGETIFIYRE